MAEKQFTTFFLGRELFGINILLVREINRKFDITPVEHAPDFVSGLMNLRGQIVTVLDLGARLGLAKREITACSRCIVLKNISQVSVSEAGRGQLQSASTDLVGLLVDGIGDIATVEDSKIEPPPANVGQVSEKYLTGVAKTEEVLVGILDVEKILKIKE